MKKALHKFFDSELDEADFYNVTKEDLINLKEYIAFLKDREAAFQNAIEDEANSIKDKCDWVERIKFAGIQFKDEDKFITSSVKLDGFGTNLELFYNKARDRYVSYPKKAPRILCVTNHSRLNRERIESIDLIQPELASIDNTGQTMFNGLLANDSASGVFEIDYEPFEGVYLYSGVRTLAVYGKVKYRYREEDLSLDDVYREKALSKILIKK